MKFNLKRFQAADAPRKKEKSYKPPGVAERRAGVIAFWVLIAFIVLLLVTDGNEADSTGQALPPPAEQNRAADTAGAEFAKAFATEYFNWTASPEGWEERKARLEPMLAQGLDEQAGLLMANQEWNSETVNAQILKLEATGPQEALVTVRIEQILTNAEDPKKKERQRHTLAVSVAFDQALGIYDLPAFVGQGQATEAQTESLKGQSLDAKTSQNIKNFLATFFQSYTTDTPDKLAYFLEDPEATHGLEGSVAFETVQAMEAVEGSAANEYVVDAEVILRDSETDTGFLSNYRLTITEKDGRYIVTKLNKGDE